MLFRSLSDNKKLLHVHHINGNKSDNSRDNLRVLCADCHKKQPHHGHLSITRDETQIINEYRRQQCKFDVFNYETVLRYTDKALEGLVLKCQSTGLPEPELGIVVNCKGKMISIDLCWPRRKVAVLIDKDNAHSLWEQGWNVFSAFNALNDFYGFQAKVR